VYGVLSQNRKMDMVFDWDKFLSFEGNSAPYIQYTHARACSVLRKADASEKITFPLNIDFLEENERNLIKTLLKFSNSLSDSCNAHMPHLLTNYLFSLCQDYNTFYNDLPIVKADEPLRSLRISLTALTASVIKTGANILTLRIPNRM
ncbi:MAG: hypothetical protein KAS32_16035, partial [Candidatus Peribacteraceae bacterium]|nr:hypothetical protein [Candidatus Peribacteraceae bacterium]